MSDEKAPKELTAAEAAKRVKRTVVEYEDGKDKDGKSIKTAKSKQVAIGSDEVLSFCDHGTHVVVVTKDGQKFRSAD